MAIRMELLEQCFGRVVVDALLFGEVHQRWPRFEPVDHRQSTRATGFARGRLITGQKHPPLMPLAAPGFTAKRIGFGTQGFVPLPRLRARLLLFFGKRHESGQVFADTRSRSTSTMFAT